MRSDGLKKLHTVLHARGTRYLNFRFLFRLLLLFVKFVSLSEEWRVNATVHSPFLSLELPVALNLLNFARFASFSLQWPAGKSLELLLILPVGT